MQKKPEAHIVGIYDKGNRHEIRYLDLDGKTKSKYSKTRREANARAKKIEATFRKAPQLAADGDLDWYALLKETARAAFDAGDFTAVVSAARAAVVYAPPPAPVDPTGDLSEKDKGELIDGFIAALEAEGYSINKTASPP